MISLQSNIVSFTFFCWIPTYMFVSMFIVRIFSPFHFIHVRRLISFCKWAERKKNAQILLKLRNKGKKRRMICAISYFSVHFKRIKNQKNSIHEAIGITMMISIFSVLFSRCELKSKETFIFEIKSIMLFVAYIQIHSCLMLIFCMSVAS